MPEDLREQPGIWQAQLPNYYGCIESIDNSVGRIRKVLEEEGLAENTIFVFFSDHGCHFATRNEEYSEAHITALSTFRSSSMGLDFVKHNRFRNLSV